MSTTEPHPDEVAGLIRRGVIYIVGTTFGTIGSTATSAIVALPVLIGVSYSFGKVPVTFAILGLLGASAWSSQRLLHGRLPESEEDDESPTSRSEWLLALTIAIGYIWLITFVTAFAGSYLFTVGSPELAIAIAMLLGVADFETALQINASPGFVIVVAVIAIPLLIVGLAYLLSNLASPRRVYGTLRRGVPRGY